MKKTTSSAESANELLLQRILMSLHELVQAAEVARDVAAKSQNLHSTDLACISYLWRVGTPISPKQIIGHLNLSSGSGTALLDRLEAAGYTRRLPNPDDRRSILIELDTERAKEPLARLKKIERSYAGFASTFSEQELLAIARFLDEMGTIAKELSDS